MSCHVYLLLSRFSDVLLGFEKGADVHGLASPYVSVYGPVEGELEGPAVEGAGHVRILLMSCWTVW